MLLWLETAERIGAAYQDCNNFVSFFCALMNASSLTGRRFTALGRGIRRKGEQKERVTREL
jgi:hypothetical protein